LKRQQENGEKIAVFYDGRNQSSGRAGTQKNQYRLPYNVLSSMKGNSGRLGSPKEGPPLASSREELLMLGIKQMRCIVFINSKASPLPRLLFRREKKENPISVQMETV
jgi:hypothetical protein